MTPEDVSQLFTLFEHITRTQSKAYDHNLYEHMANEHKHHLKFHSWIQQTYPHVWESWQALLDLERSV
jgi:hypothetical protein